MKYILKTIWVILLIASGLGIFIVGLSFTTSGTHVLLKTFSYFSPIPLHFDNVQGTLGQGMEINGLQLELSSDVMLLMPSSTIKIMRVGQQWQINMNAPITQIETSALPTVLNLEKVTLQLLGWPNAYRMHLTTQLNFPDYPSSQWQLIGKGNLSDFIIEALTINTPHGKLAFTGTVAWSPSITWDIIGRAEQLQFSPYLSSENKPQLQANFSSTGHYFPQEPQHNQWQLDFSMPFFPLKVFEPWLKDMNLPGIANIQAELKQEPNEILKIDSAITFPANKIILPITVQNGSKESIAYQDSKIMLKTLKDGLHIDLNLNFDKRNYIHGKYLLPKWLTRTQQDFGNQPFNGELQLVFTNFSILELLSADINAETGELRGKMFFSRTLANPYIKGNLQLNKTKLYILPLNIYLNYIHVVLEGDLQNIFHYQANVGNAQGSLKIVGDSHFAGMQPVSQFNIQGENFLIYDLPDKQIYVSPNLDLVFSSPNIELTGNLLIPRANITTTDFNGYIPPSNDVVISRPVQESTIRTSPWQFTANLQLKLGDHIYYQGNGVKSKINGQLQLHQQQEITTAQGELKLVDGVYTAYDKNLSISQGRLFYQGGNIANPSLDIRAERAINVLSSPGKSHERLVDASHIRNVNRNGVVGVQVQGTLHQPKISLFSNPSMSANDQLSYLIADVPSSQLSAAQGQLLAEAAFNLAHKNSTAGVTQKLSTVLGLDEASLASSHDFDPVTGTALSNTSLVLGKALSPKLFVRYSVGLLDPINIIQLQYKLSHYWLLQTNSSSDGNSGGDIIYYFESD